MSNLIMIFDLPTGSFSEWTINLPGDHKILDVSYTDGGQANLYAEGSSDWGNTVQRRFWGLRAQDMIPVINGVQLIPVGTLVRENYSTIFVYTLPL